MSLPFEDGGYTAEVALSGGSGKAAVISPAEINIEDGKITAEIVWSSPNYDYMEVDGTGYYPVSTDGNSIFIIDVPCFDEDIPVLAETVAMSEPHMIEYTLNFSSESLKPDKNFSWGILCAVGAVLVISAAVTAMLIKRKKKSNESNK